MRIRHKTWIIPVSLVLLAGGTHERGPRTRTSQVTLEPGRPQSGRTIRVQAGAVELVHQVLGSARLRGTRLEGVEDHNRDVEYNWPEDGEYVVEVSGRYRHTVLGAVAGAERGSRLVSRLTYEELPDTTR